MAMLQWMVLVVVRVIRVVVEVGWDDCRCLMGQRMGRR